MIPLRYLFIVFMLCCFSSCGDHHVVSHQVNFPADSLIPRDEMINVLADIHLAEAALQFQQNKHLNIPERARSYYGWLCSKYHFSRKRLMYNLDYYSQDVDQFSMMYKEVVKILNERAKKPAGVKK